MGPYWYVYVTYIMSILGFQIRGPYQGPMVLYLEGSLLDC